MDKKGARAARQVKLARLSWEMQELQTANKILAVASADEAIEIQWIYNHAMRECYKQYVKIAGKADVAGWESFALFVLGCKPPDMAEDAPATTAPEGETHATDGS